MAGEIVLLQGGGGKRGFGIEEAGKLSDEVFPLFRMLVMIPLRGFVEFHEMNASYLFERLPDLSFRILLFLARFRRYLGSRRVLIVFVK